MNSADHARFREVSDESDYRSRDDRIVTDSSCRIHLRVVDCTGKNVATDKS
jgi:hypothetical protein